MPLTPRVSVVGHNGAGQAVSELPDVEAEVFHVGGRGDQAMVVAFDLMPGCHGYIEHVQQFLCGADYGVISDEWVVERVLKNKWRLGGFARSLTQTQPVRIKRGDREEDATVDLSLSLDDLSVAAVECDANTATDYVRVGGPATGTPLILRLQDGTVMRPDQVDLGGPAALNWTVFTDPTLNPLLSSDAQMRQWQERAHMDGYRHLARPFAYFPEGGIDVDYARVEGVITHIFFLGSCWATFP